MSIDVSNREAALAVWTIYERELAAWEKEREEYAQLGPAYVEHFEKAMPRPTPPRGEKPEPIAEEPFVPASVRMPEKPKPEPQKEVPKLELAVSRTDSDVESQGWDKQKLLDWWQKAFPAFQRLCKAQGMIEPTEEQIQQALAESWGFVTTVSSLPPERFAATVENVSLLPSQSFVATDTGVSSLPQGKKLNTQQQWKIFFKQVILNFFIKNPDSLLSAKQLKQIFQTDITDETIRDYCTELYKEEKLDRQEQFQRVPGKKHPTRRFLFKIRV